jgi:hypothetical protein
MWEVGSDGGFPQAVMRQAHCAARSQWHRSAKLLFGV